MIRLRFVLFLPPYMNPENAREVFPFLKKIECIIQKPVEIPDLIGRVKAKLMWET